METPDLVSQDPGARFMAEKKVDLMHAFPIIEQKQRSGYKKKNKTNKRQKLGGKGFGK